MPPHARHGAKSVKVRWLHLCQDASYDRRHPLSPPQWSLACLFAYCFPGPRSTERSTVFINLGPSLDDSSQTFEDSSS